jgi:hypothetical protein
MITDLSVVFAQLECNAISDDWYNYFLDPPVPLFFIFFFSEVVFFLRVVVFFVAVFFLTIIDSLFMPLAIQFYRKDDSRIASRISHIDISEIFVQYEKKWSLKRCFPK